MGVVPTTLGSQHRTPLIQSASAPRPARMSPRTVPVSLPSHSTKVVRPSINGFCAIIPQIISEAPNQPPELPSFQFRAARMFSSVREFRSEMASPMTPNEPAVVGRA